MDWETGEPLQLCDAIDRALHLRELLIPPLPSSRPSVEHDTLLQALQSSYSCSPPKPLAGHLQHCQTEERFITRPTTCTDSAACVRVLSPPAVGCEELCTGHWVQVGGLMVACVLCSLCRTVHPLTLWFLSAVTAEHLFTTFAVECAHISHIVISARPHARLHVQ